MTKAKRTRAAKAASLPSLTRSRLRSSSSRRLIRDSSRCAGAGTPAGVPNLAKPGTPIAAALCWWRAMPARPSRLACCECGVWCVCVCGRGGVVPFGYSVVSGWPPDRSLL
eukprot:364806-Chlamydomonas_euryale.AAC.2